MATERRVVEGPHKSVFNKSKMVLSVIFEDSFRHEVDWEYDTIMQPYLVDALLDDVGLHDEEVRAATKAFCLETLAYPGIEMTHRELDTEVSGFISGYEACQKKHGLPMRLPPPDPTR
jgi:hypothetical protein